MEGMEEKLGAILGNPQMMQTIMNMAQQLGQQQAPSQEQSSALSQGMPQFGSNEIEMIQKIASFTRQTGLDPDQQQLLKALNPYLSHDRVGKLEKAMHAAKLAKFASVALGQMGSGR